MSNFNCEAIENRLRKNGIDLVVRMKWIEKVRLNWDNIYDFKYSKLATTLLRGATVATVNLNI